MARVTDRYLTVQQDILETPPARPLRAKGLIERVHAPLTAGLLRPITADARLAEESAISSTVSISASSPTSTLLQAIGLRTAA